MPPEWKDVFGGKEKDIEKTGSKKTHPNRLLGDQIGIKILFSAG